MAGVFYRGMYRLRTELRDLVELFLVPGLAVFLPWGLAFKAFKLVSHCGFMYQQAVDTACVQAHFYSTIQDEKRWKATRRLITLVDHADLFLVQTRTKHWLARHMDVRGTWPEPDQSAMLLTFHWGAGMWVLPHMRSCDLNVHALVAPVSGTQFKGRSVLRAYAQIRTRRVAHELGRETLDVSASLRPALILLRKKEQLLAVVDVPVDQVSSSHEIVLLGAQARVPRALFRLAVEQQVPISVFVIGLDPHTGRRFLRIDSLGVRGNIEELIADVFERLESSMQLNPAAWHFWGEASRFFLRNPSSSMD